MNLNFDEIKEKIEKLGSDHTGRFGGNYNGGIYLQQSPTEMTKLLLFLIDRNRMYRNYLEVGCAAGGFAFLMNLFFNIENMVLIDDGKHVRAKMLPEVLKDVNYQLWTGDSQSKQAVDFLRSLNLKFDIIIIDADHSYNGVKKDTYNFIEFLDKDGFVIFHDTEVKTCGIMKWLGEIKEDNLFNLKEVAEFVEQPGKLGIKVYKQC
jgi:predicted O-methyltransferase YrrM